MSTNNKIVLIDGHSILTRAFFGIPDLTNSKGMHTNAVYGFLNIMFKILDEEKPQNLVVAFDVKAPTFRHDIFKEYKGTRKPMPNELHEQVPVIKEVLKSMNITVIEKPGYEADDVLGTIAKNSKEKGYKVVIVSGDRDLLQLADNDVLIRIPKTKQSGTEVENYFANDVIEKYGVTPKEFIDLKALMGDTSDNIPGVKSIGEKTASKLISEYKTIENIYEKIDSVTPERVKNALINDEENARLSKVLATINVDSPIDIKLDETIITNIYNDEAYKHIKNLEFKSMFSKFNITTEEINDVNIESMIIEIKEESDIPNLLNTLNVAKDSKYIGICYNYFEDFQIATLTISQNDKIYFLDNTEGLSKDRLISIIKDLNKTFTISILDLKKTLKHIDFSLNDNVLDCMIGAYLLNPLKSTYSYSDIARDYLGMVFETKEEIAGKMSLFELFNLDRHKYIMLTSHESYSMFSASANIEKQLEETNMLELYKEIEFPTVFVLDEMEKNGIRVDGVSLKEYGDNLKTIISKIEAEIFEEIGEKFNLNSSKQLGEILFGKLGMPGGKKTKTGYSTSADVLEKLAPEYPIVNKILEYRQLAKLNSTYADGLSNYIGYDERIHGTFNQTITATGRISSTEPNLQNIPIRMELGRQIRKVFIPKEDYTFIDADYSQIELRIMAHMSNDENLIDAYNSEQDIHKITAAKVFKTPLDEVTQTMRNNAKAVNFGIIYGISSFGLSQDLSISKKEASEYIKQYFETYPSVKKYLDDTVEFAKEHGYVKTLFGRIRPIPELKSSNFMQRAFGERVAMNSVIQGTAADIMKIAMINVYKQLSEKGLKSKLILQVHDEMVVETHISEVDIVKSIIEDAMMNAAKLKVILEIGIGQGNNWLEAH